MGKGAFADGTEREQERERAKGSTMDDDDGLRRF